MNAFQILIELHATEQRSMIMNILNMTKRIYQNNPEYSALSSRNDMGMLATWVGMIAGVKYPKTSQVIEQFNQRNRDIDTIEGALDGADGLFFSSNKEQIKDFALSASLLIASQIPNMN